MVYSAPHKDRCLVLDPFRGQACSASPHLRAGMSDPFSVRLVCPNCVQLLCHDTMQGPEKLILQYCLLTCLGGSAVQIKALCRSCSITI